ncbi:MAG TPA: 3'(2'),5'-bisphosphate nucleotidase CysQ [Caulobacteraceae bacterium]|jgi:3'(2'), 5'-bisphosphate nucleotidase
MTVTRFADPDLGARLADIVEEAARLILPLWKSGLEVIAKADESPVTEADRRGEALILERLAEAFPDTPVLGEEHCSDHGAPDRIGAIFFAVDPLDGTKAFVRGDPSFTVNIGLIDAGRPVAGAVNAPATAETWFTGLGGAWKRVGGSATHRICARPWNTGDAVALVSHSMKPEAQAALKAEFGVSLTLPMDSSIKLCRIAEGEADIYVRRGPTMEWDIAAGHAVLAAAGGRLTTPEGDPFLYGKAAAGFRNGPLIARGAA